MPISNSQAVVSGGTHIIPDTTRTLLSYFTVATRESQCYQRFITKNLTCHRETLLLLFYACVVQLLIIQAFRTRLKDLFFL